MILFVVASWDNNFFVAVIMIILAGSSIGFLWHNFNPASIFMGDCGSMLLGFILASICIMDAYKGALAISLSIPFIALGLPIFDTVSSFIRRIYHGKPPFQADKNHIHHKLLRLGLNQQEAVGILYLISLILGGVALFLAAKKGSNLIIYLCGIAILVIFFMLRGEKKFLSIIKDKFRHKHIVENINGDKK
ncbi:undecaprenyl/decaprenyl-phosphate alpha-N-acetylglucosaminyl 1-phosphate transferase [Candidatus Desantisbacteria bacterium]|nr:undecaprenyl/decaprenyl-phosphate alpha-N-acetylglucosaminyl 1-phosphate transferase [Candidatus Desantisbacteria bacterium]